MGESMTNEELDRFQALADAATPGPWRIDDDCEGDLRDVVAPIPGHDTTLTVAETWTDADAALIAAMREALPRLVAEVRALREGLGELVRMYSGADEQMTIKEIAAVMDKVRALLDGGGKCENYEPAAQTIAALRERAERAEREAQAFRFYSDEFCQGDDTAEDAAHAMFDAVVKHRHRAEAALARVAALERVAEAAEAREAALRGALSNLVNALTPPRNPSAAGLVMLLERARAALDAAKEVDRG